MFPTGVVNQGALQPEARPVQIPLQGQFQFPGPWFPSGQSHSGMHASSVHLSSSPLNPSNMPSLFGPRPTPMVGFNSFLQNSPVPPRPQPPTQVLQNLYMAQTSPLGHIGQLRNPSMTALQPSSAQPNVSGHFPFTSSQPPTRPASVAGPLMASIPQPMSGIQPLTPAGGSWSAHASASASLGLSNMGQMAPQMVSPNRPHPQNPQPGIASMAPPSNVSTASLASPNFFPSQSSTPQLSSNAVNRPFAAPHFALNPPLQGGNPAAFSHSLHQTPAPVPAPNSSTNPGLGSASIPSPSSTLQSGRPNSVSGSTPNFTSIKPPTITAPSSGDFTFQPRRPQNPVSQTVPTSSSQPASQSTLQVQPPTPQAPSFRLAMPNITPQPVNQVLQRPQFSNLAGQPLAPVSAVPYAGSPTPIGPPRLPAFPNASVAPRTPLPQMGPRNFSPAPQMPNLPGPILHRPGNSLQLQQNYPARTRPEIHLAPNQQFSNTFSFASSKPVSKPGGQQIYDPFSPTSVPTSKSEG